MDFRSHAKKYRSVIEGRNKQNNERWKDENRYNMFRFFDTDFCMINLRKYGTVIEMSNTEQKYTSLQRNAG